MIRYDFHKDLNLVVWTITGHVSANDIVRELEEMVADKQYIPGMSVISDSRKMESNFSLDDYYKITMATKEVYGPFKIKVKCAGLFAAHSPQLDMGHIYAAYSQDTPVEFASFTNINDVKKWLDIPSNISVKIKN